MTDNVGSVTAKCDLGGLRRVAMRFCAIQGRKSQTAVDD